jgi:hypothetical protein
MSLLGREPGDTDFEKRTNWPIEESGVRLFVKEIYRIKNVTTLDPSLH